MINLELREPFETVEEFKKEAKKHKLPYKIFDLNGNSYTVEIGNGKIFIKEKGRNFFSYELFSFTFDDGTPCGKVKYNNKELNKRIDRLCYLMQKFMKRLLNTLGNTLACLLLKLSMAIW